MNPGHDSPGEPGPKAIPAEASPGDLLPRGLPHACPRCGRPFSLFSNYSTRTSRLGRRLHALAILGGPVGLALVLVLNGILTRNVESIGRSLPYGMMLGLLAPVILFEGLALICPKVRTLRCHACAWEKDFPWPHQPSSPPKSPGH